MTKTERQKLKALPVRENNNCFACGPQNSNGLQMKFYTDESSLFSFISIPKHMCGWNNVVHGGIISTMLDEIMSWSALYLLKKIILTKSITVDFIKPIIVEQPLTVIGQLNEHVHERKAVMSGKIYDNKDEICSKSVGTFSLFTPERIKEHKIMDEDAMSSLLEFMTL